MNDNFPVEISQTTTLTITSLHFYRDISVYVRCVLTIIQIYHLELISCKFLINTLIQLIDLLPDLTALKIHPLTFHESRSTHVERFLICWLEKRPCKITKVYIEEISELYFLLKFSSRLEYLELNNIVDIRYT